MKLAIALLFALLLWGRAAHAEETLAITDIIRLTLENNPELQAARLRAAAATSEAGAAGWLPMPMVEWQHERDDRLVSVMRNQYMLEQTVPLGGKLGGESGMAGAMARAAEQALRQAELDAVGMASQAYYMLYMAEQQLRINREAQDTLGTLVAVAESRVAAGKASLSDALMARAQRESLRAEDKALELEITRRRVMLARAAGVESLPPGATEPPAIGFTGDLEELHQTVLDWLPKLKAQRAMVEVANARADMMHAEFYPDITVGAGYAEERAMTAGGGSMSVTSEKEKAWMFQLGLSLPLWWGTISRREEAARATAEAESVMSLAVENEAIVDFTNAYADAKSAEARARSLEESQLPLAREAYALALREYRTGMMDFLRVIQMQRAVQMMEMKYEEARAEFGRAMADIQCCLGLPSNETLNIQEAKP